MTTKPDILSAAVKIGRGGLHLVTLRGVARAVGVDHRTVVWHFTDLAGLRLAVAQEAIARDDRQIIARLIMDGHPLCEKWSAVRRRRYLTG